MKNLDLSTLGIETGGTILSSPLFLVLKHDSLVFFQFHIETVEEEKSVNCFVEGDMLLGGALFHSKRAVLKTFCKITI